jgi:hypothetical protein
MKSHSTGILTNNSTALLTKKMAECISYMAITIASQEDSNIYYVVTTQIPMGGKKWEVGYYLTEELAQKIAAKIDEFNQDINIRKAGGLNVKVDKYQGEMIKCEQYVRLQDMPKGCITIIEDETNLGYSYDSLNPAIGQRAKLDNLRSTLAEEALQLNNRPVVTLEYDCNLLRAKR